MTKRAREEEGGSSGDSSPTALPEDVLSTIFSHLDVSERARASRVCRKWRAAALQPPYSTELTLRVRLAGDGAYVHGGEPAVAAAATAENAVALFGGPLCSGLRRLILGFVLPGELEEAPRRRLLAVITLTSTSTSAMTTIGAALPPTLRALSLALLLEGFDIRVAGSEVWRNVLAHLDLARTAPRLEELELNLGETASFEELNFGHPSLKRLGAEVRAKSVELLSLALQRLRRLEVVDSISVDPSTYGRALERQAIFAAFTNANIRTKLLRLIALRAVADPPHLWRQLLKPGAVVELMCCSLPSDEGWTFPAGISSSKLRIHLIDCSIPLAQLEHLLQHASTTAPGLERLIIRNSGLFFDRAPWDAEWPWAPHDFVGVLERWPGGTQIEFTCPPGFTRMLDTIRNLPRVPPFVAPLVRALASSPTLHGYLHVPLPPSLLRILPPDVAADYATYRRARATALRGMGEAGRRLLAEQGYDREDN